MPNRQSNTLKVSVIIPTRNRRELLREVIESLCNQTLDPNGFEIIVMDNASTDGTPVLIKHLQARSPCTIRYGQLSSNLGPVQARNLGVKLAEAEIVAFTDSDCRAHPEWLERGLQVLTESDGSAFVAGAVLDKPDQAVSFFTIRNGAVPGENYTYPTCNVFYRKSVFLEMGGFDESVWLCDIANSPIECADTDLAWRIKEAGYETAYLDDLIIYHEVARATPRNWLLYHTRLLVIPELVRRHPQLRKKLLQWGLFLLC